MEVIMKKISELTQAKGNAKIHTYEQISHIESSILEFGIKTVAVITEKNEIVVGHGRIQAAANLGIEEYPCIVADDLTDEQIRAFRLIDNQTALETPFDPDKLRVELGGIVNIDLSIMARFDSESGLFGRIDINGADGFFTSAANDEEAAAVMAKIDAESEFSQTADDKAEKIKAQTSAAITRLAGEKPELLSKAICVIVPSGRGDFRDCVVIADPKLGDVADELKRYADDGIESPCAALLEGLVSFAPDA